MKWNSTQVKRDLLTAYRRITWKIWVYLKANPDVLAENNNQEVFDEVARIQTDIYLRRNPDQTRDEAFSAQDFISGLEAKYNADDYYFEQELMDLFTAKTGYGYIHAAGAAEGEISKVSGFREKPDLATARAYLDEGGFFWNAGIFVWNAETVSVQMRRFAPQIAGIMDELAPSFYSDREAAELSRLFPRCDRISIDYAVMERSDDIYVIPDNPGWSDLGSWGAVRSHMAQDAAGNASVGEDVRLFGCSNCIVHAEGGGTVVAEGLDGYIIARRGDNMLVCRLSEEQRIKEFSALKK